MKRANKTRANKTKQTAETRAKDPRGGLTAAGRRESAKKDGSHLKPGVKKSQADMTAEEMRRKGSWAVRFYGRSGPLPPLQDKHGKPTRFALTAAAWGEPVPMTAAAARKIAAKGKLLTRRSKNARLVKILRIVKNWLSLIWRGLLYRARLCSI